VLQSIETCATTCPNGRIKIVAAISSQAVTSRQDREEHMRASAATPRTKRRRLAALVAAGAIGLSAVGVVVPESAAQAAPPQYCWYHGWFKEGGVWYQGWFKELC